MKEEAIARGEQFSDEEYSEEDDDPGNIPNADSGTVLTHVKSYIRFLQMQIINNSDVLLEVIDARDPIVSTSI